MASENSQSIVILNAVIRYVFQYGTPVLYVMGNLGNAFSAWIFLKRAWRKNVCVFYFIVCLIFNTGYINSTLLGSIFTFGFEINLLNSSAVLCKLFYYTAYVFSILFLNVLFLASVDRLLISSQDVETRLYSSKRLAYFLCTVSTIFWIVFNVHALVKVDLQQVSPSYQFCYSEQTPFYLQFSIYSSLAINLSISIAMIFLLVFAFRNVRRICAAPRQQQRQQIRTMTKKDFQLLRCLFAQDLIYVVFSIPTNIVYVFQAVPKDQLPSASEEAIVYFFNLLSTFLHHIPYCAIFFVFLILSRAFRNEFKRMVFNNCGEVVAPLREEDNPDRNVAVVAHVS